jgi:hypothetical protein
MPPTLLVSAQNAGADDLPGQDSVPAPGQSRGIPKGRSPWARLFLFSPRERKEAAGGSPRRYLLHLDNKHPTDEQLLFRFKNRSTFSRAAREKVAKRAEPRRRLLHAVPSLDPPLLQIAAAERIKVRNALNKGTQKMFRDYPRCRSVGI